MTDAAAPPFRERFYRCQDGLRLYYRDYGDPTYRAPALICLGGLTRNAKDFAALAERVSATGRRVLCPDYRGRGRSDYDADWHRYHPRSYVDDIRHLVVSAQVHRIVVVGTSLGGVLAMALATAMPTMLAGAVLNDVGPDIREDGLDPIYDFLRDIEPVADWQAAADRLRRHFGHWHEADAEAWITFAKATCREETDGRIVPDWDPLLAKPILATPRATVDLWPLYHALRQVPVLVLRGALSTLLTTDTLDRMAEGMPLMTAVTVPRVGHAPTLAEPAAADAIDAFLARC